MIGDAALTVVATSSSARIHATVTSASPIAGTVAAQNAFWPARTVRVADVIGRADAIDTAARRFLTLGVGSARMRFARTLRLHNIRFD